MESSEVLFTFFYISCYADISVTLYAPHNLTLRSIGDSLNEACENNNCFESLSESIKFYSVFHVLHIMVNLSLMSNLVQNNSNQQTL